MTHLGCKPWRIHILLTVLHHPLHTGERGVAKHNLHRVV